MPRKLTDTDRERYCSEYLKDLNITRAGERAGISKRTAISWMQQEDVLQRIAELCVERNAACKLEANEVLREVHAIATADPRELVEIKRTPCAQCWEGKPEGRGAEDGCPVCAGDGLVRVYVKDTANLSPAARALFAGAKQTKEGIEVKLHDKSKHLELLMRHLGLLNDKLEVSGTLSLADRIVKSRKRAGT